MTICIRGGGGYADVPPGAVQYTQYSAGNQEFPNETASGRSVSSSDKDDLEEAREEYEGQYEEYEEQYEETDGSD